LPTNYLLLCALTLVVLLFCELAATTGRTPIWGVAGVFAGLAALTNFYGWVTFGFAAIAAIVWLRSWDRLRALAVFGATAMVVASPWLIRNWLLLGDPLYPLASPPFHAVGLAQPLWDASKAEIVQ